MLSTLLEKLADTKFRSKTEAAYLKFFGVEGLDGPYLINYLFKKNSFVNKNASSSFNHIVPRLQICLNVLENIKQYESKGKLNLNNYPYSPLFDKIKDSIEANSQDLRKISQTILVSIYREQGFKRIEGVIS